MAPSTLRSPLDDLHREHGARMVDFAGWSMPIQYQSIVEEHRATRTAVGVFDVSHMGRLRVEGLDAGRFLDGLLTRRVLDMEPGRIRYALVTNERGGVLDDVLVYHLEAPRGRSYYLLVVNASNCVKVVEWIRGRMDGAGDVELADRTRETAMIAVQGPLALQVVQPLFTRQLNALEYYAGLVTEQLGRPCTISRTGYTGEDGYELIVGAEDAADVWKKLFQAGRECGIAAAGLGARDTLRLEAGMPLYGHELGEQITPLQAGLGFAVNLEGRDFVGRDAVAAAGKDPHLPRRVGLALHGRRVPREGHEVLDGGACVGRVTSGTFSPTLEQPIAMAYVTPASAQVGRDLEAEIRGHRELARVVRLPFYRRSGSKRGVAS